MNTQLTRRTVALGAPSMLLLSACGGGGDDSLVASSPQPTAAEESAAELESPAFVDMAVLGVNFEYWYDTKFFNHARSAMVASVSESYTQLRLTNPSLPNYTVSDFAFNPDALEYGYQVVNNSNLNLAMEAGVRARCRLVTATPTFSAPPYSQTELEFYANNFYGMSSEQLIPYVAHKQTVFAKMGNFLRAVLVPQMYAQFNLNLYFARILNERYYVKGAVPDTVEVEPGWIFGTQPILLIKFGNLRGTVQRHALDYDRTWFGKRPTPESIILAGKNTTTVVPTEGYYGVPWPAGNGRTVSKDFVVGEEQQKGIDYYVKKDIDDNGPFTGMSDLQSRQLLAEYTKIACKESGLVYEAYLVAQIAVRTISLGTIAVTRWLIHDKYIDLGKLALTASALLLESPAVQAQSVDGRNSLQRAMSVLLGTATAGVILQALAISAAREIVKANKSKNTTQATDTLQTLDKVKVGLLTQQTVATLNAMGVISAAGFNQLDQTAHIVKWVSPSFALADLASGVSDIVGVLRAGTQGTSTGAFLCMGGGMRIIGATYTVAEHAYKMYYKDWNRVYSTSVTALAINTATAGIGTIFYFLAAMYVFE
jgi:hypothetical protein